MTKILKIEGTYFETKEVVLALFEENSHPLYVDFLEAANDSDKGSVFYVENVLTNLVRNGEAAREVVMVPAVRYTLTRRGDIQGTNRKGER